MNKAGWLLLALGMMAAHADQPPPAAKLNWYRGNTHTHSINADGDATTDVIVRWYREHGYQFVVMSEHEFITDIAPLNAMYGATERFLVISGQEVTQILLDDTHPEGKRHAHVNAIGLDRAIMPVSNTENFRIARDITMSEAYRRNFAAIRAAKALPQLNHPNGRWSVRPADVAELSGVFLLEIWNGNPKSNNLGGTSERGEKSVSAESLWDILLSQGKTVWGVAADDSHDYFDLSNFASERPGVAWIMVRAPELTTKALLDAMYRGDFYASTGVALEYYAVDRTGMKITIKQPYDSRGLDDSRFTTRFIGKNGTMLAEVPGLQPSYVFRGDEGYVRASIQDSNGLRGWTQPHFLK